MMVKVGMEIAEVLKVREDVHKVSEEMLDGVLFEDYEGEAYDGAILCIEVEEGVVSEVVKAMYV